MANARIYNGIEQMQQLRELKEAMNNREVSFNCVDAEYLMEDIYTLL